jgi:transposase-like protein
MQPAALSMHDTMPENEEAGALRPTAPGTAGQDLRKRESDMSNATAAQHYQLFPALEPATEAALKASIVRFGVLVPVTVDQHGNILDGHHRKRIADELGVDCDIRVRRVNGEDEANEIARTLNMDRRHLSAEDRRRMVEALRSERTANGEHVHSYRAIAKALGVSHTQARRDIDEHASGGTYVPPELVRGSDGKSYPARRPEPITRPTAVTEAALTLAAAEPDRDDDDIEAEAQAIAHAAQPATVAELAQACGANLDSRRTPTKREHPAVFSDAILDIAAAHLNELGVTGTVVDPFAGTGRVHELRDKAPVTTIGVEIEPEWATKHPDTVQGNALKLTDTVAPGSADAIVTSPTYGNRMADHHEARDDSVRNTYTHTLGRPLAADNSGQMQWGDEYRDFHRKAWAEAVAVLKPGGTFTVNCKNHIRAGQEQRVVEWQINTLMRDFGLTLEALDIIPTKGLPVGTNGGTYSRTLFELVATFRKPAP